MNIASIPSRQLPLPLHLPSYGINGMKIIYPLSANQKDFTGVIYWLQGSVVSAEALMIR